MHPNFLYGIRAKHPRVQEVHVYLYIYIWVEKEREKMAKRDTYVP